MPDIDGKTLRINSADVAFEIIDGEVIAIDFSRGSYYNLAGGGVQIWEILGAGATIEQIASSFELADGQRAEIDMFLGRLHAEALIAVDDEPADPGATGSAGEPAEFVAPRFEKYDDMQDYFVLDPIHDVDATGWPKPKPE